MKLLIPCAPVYKKRPRFGNGRAYDIQGREKAFYIASTKPQLPCDFKPFAGPLCLDLTFALPIPASISKKRAKALHLTPHCKKPDLDNFIKWIDVWTNILWIDDAQIHRITARKIWHFEPHTILELAENL